MQRQLQDETAFVVIGAGACGNQPNPVPGHDHHVRISLDMGDGGFEFELIQGLAGRAVVERKSVAEVDVPGFHLCIGFGIQAADLIGIGALMEVGVQGLAVHGDRLRCDQDLSRGAVHPPPNQWDQCQDNAGSDRDGDPFVFGGTALGGG